MNKKKEDRIIRLLMQIQAIWVKEHPDQLLSMAVGTNYLSAYSLDDKQRYVFNRSVVKGVELYRTEGGKHETV